MHNLAKLARGGALATCIVLTLSASCNRDLDTSFAWGPWGGASGLVSVEDAIQQLIDAGGGWTGDRWKFPHLYVAVVDAHTKAGLANVPVLVGSGASTSDYLTSYTDSNGRVTFSYNELNNAGVNIAMVTAVATDYETLTIDNSIAPILVFALRPNVANRYSEVRGDVSNSNSSDYHKFELSCSHAVRAMDTVGTRYDRDGFNERGTFRFFVPADSSSDLAVLEFNSGYPMNYQEEGVAGTGGGSVVTHSPSLPLSPPAFTDVGGGDYFSFTRPSEFNSIDEETCRARVIAFRPGAISPFVTGFTFINTMNDDFSIASYTGSGIENFRGAIHVESTTWGYEGWTCDFFWDMGDPMTFSGRQFNLPGTPQNLNPQDGQKDLGPGPTFDWHSADSTDSGFFEMLITDPMKRFPENLVWRVWKNVNDPGWGTGHNTFGIHFDDSMGLQGLLFEKPYQWQLIRYRIPSQPAYNSPMYYGLRARTAEAVVRSPRRSFLIDINGEGPSQFIDETAQTLGAEGGGVKGSQNASTHRFFVFDASTESPIPGASIFVGNNTLDLLSTDASGMASYSPGSGSADQTRVITACASGYENTTFFGHTGHIVAIPLRPTLGSSYAQVGGSVYNTGTLAFRGAVSVGHGVDGQNRIIVSEGQNYSFYVQPNLSFPVTSLSHGSTGNMANFQWFDHDALNPGQTHPNLDQDLQGTQTHEIVPVGWGNTAYFSNLGTVTGGYSLARGGGFSASKPWRTVAVGLGYYDTGGGYRLDAAKLPEVRHLTTELFVQGTDAASVPGTATASLSLTDLLRTPPDISFPPFPCLIGPSNAATAVSKQTVFDFYPNSGQNENSGPSVLHVRASGTGFPGALKWRIFIWPSDSGTSVQIPNIVSGGFDLQSGATYEWWVEQNFGSYYLESGSFSSFYLGKFSLGWLERFQSFLCESEHRTFTVQ